MGHYYTFLSTYHAIQFPVGSCKSIECIGSTVSSVRITIFYTCPLSCLHFFVYSNSSHLVSCFLRWPTTRDLAAILSGMWTSRATFIMASHRILAYMHDGGAGLWLSSQSVRAHRLSFLCDSVRNHINSWSPSVCRQILTSTPPVYAPTVLWLSLITVKRHEGTGAQD